jgi:hypothetical protein
VKRIQPVVEGHGDREAVPVLLRRLLHRDEVFDVDVGKPVRWPRSKLRRPEALRQAVALARMQADCAAIPVLFDTDGECPVSLLRELGAAARDAGGGVPVETVFAHREFEAWFLASSEAMGVPPTHEDPETVSGAKERLRDAVRGAYHEVADQPRFAANCDLDAASRSARSFRAFESAVRRLIAAVRGG